MSEIDDLKALEEAREGEAYWRTVAERNVGLHALLEDRLRNLNLHLPKVVELAEKDIKLRDRAEERADAVAIDRVKFKSRIALAATAILTPLGTLLIAWLSGLLGVQ